MVKVFIKVFSQVRYSAITILVSLVVFSFAVWLPNLKLISLIVVDQNITILTKVTFLVSLLGSIKTNFTFLALNYTIAISILFGLNTALFIYYINSRRSSKSQQGTIAGVGGLVSGLFGIGCASCGTFILSVLLGVFGASTFLASLPFGGAEFGFIGVGLLSYSFYINLKKITEPVVCES